MRKIVVHYHLYKNAGTSIDRALVEALGADRCASLEAEKGLLDPQALTEFIAAHPHHVAFSSHTARFPLPVLDDCLVFPILFVRHPIDRVRSVYLFERQQNVSNPGTDAAKTMGFKEYVEWRLGYDRLFCDFQIARCNPKPARASLATTLAFLDTLPFVGMVEGFERSIARLNGKLGEHFPGLVLKSHHANQMQDHSKLLRLRVNDIEDELGAETYGRLVRSNRGDLRLFSTVRASYQETPVPQA